MIRYVLGTFGKPTAPVEPSVLDRVLSRPRAAELASEPPPLYGGRAAAAVRGADGDEELLLRFGMPGGEVDGMVAAAPRGHALQPGPAAGAAAAAGAGRAGRRRELTVDKPGFRLSVRGGQRD